MTDEDTTTASLEPSLPAYVHPALFPDHDCNEVCEATGFGMRALFGPTLTGTPIHVTACFMHERCLVVEESGGHYQRLP